MEGDKCTELVSALLIRYQNYLMHYLIAEEHTACFPPKNSVVGLVGVGFVVLGFFCGFLLVVVVVFWFCGGFIWGEGRDLNKILVQSRKSQNNYFVFKPENSIKTDTILHSWTSGTILYAELYRLRVSWRQSSHSHILFFFPLSLLIITPLPTILAIIRLLQPSLSSKT